VDSLVGATKEVDESTLHRTDYVRIKIVARDVSKIPDKAEWAILPFLYDFCYERELQMGTNEDGETVMVQSDKGGPMHPSPKKQETIGQSSNQAHLQIEVFADPKGKGAQDEIQSISSLPKFCLESKSAPPKAASEKVSVQPKLMADAHKFRYKADGNKISPLNAGEERVQGLSGENINDSEEDMLSSDTQGSQSNQQQDKEKHMVGLVKCFKIVLHQTRGAETKVKEITKEIPDAMETIVKNSPNEDLAFKLKKDSEVAVLEDIKDDLGHKEVTVGDRDL
jgi:hypothetical protein